MLVQALAGAASSVVAAGLLTFGGIAPAAGVDGQPSATEGVSLAAFTGPNTSCRYVRHSGYFYWVGGVRHWSPPRWECE